MSWSIEKVKTTLNIKEIGWDDWQAKYGDQLSQEEGISNSVSRIYALNPETGNVSVAVHEVAHIVLDHSDAAINTFTPFIMGQKAFYGWKEFSAEYAAYLLMGQLGALEEHEEALERYLDHYWSWMPPSIGEDALSQGAFAAKLIWEAGQE